MKSARVGVLFICSFPKSRRVPLPERRIALSDESLVGAIRQSMTARWVGWIADGARLLTVTIAILLAICKDPFGSLSIPPQLV